MAAWHYRMLMVGLGQLPRLDRVADRSLSDWKDDVPFDINTFRINLQEDADFKKVKSDENYMEIWSDEHGNQIEIIIDGSEKIEEIGIRIDCRVKYNDFIKSIACLAKKLKCAFVRVSGGDLMDSEMAIMASVNNSWNKMILEDPENLSGLSEDIRNAEDRGKDG